MSDIIHLLPDSVANQIAAGEVIQRPASVLKELVENSIDAGATHIQILIKDAGRTLIQVVDNGKGMSTTDARMAFERHATSKISDASDLFSLHTMGFRGEALASIAAVAQVEMRTRRPDDELGTCIEIAGSRVIAQESIQCQAGTCFKVKNLFFNVPARRRFLKSDNVERNHLLNEFYRVALAHPHIAFTFIDGTEEVFRLDPSNIRLRVESVFGKTSRKRGEQQLLSVEVDTQLARIYGYIAKPEHAQKSANQYFFANGRYMRHPYFHKAVMTAYDKLLPSGMSPGYFIYFEVSPDTIDINIHPTKTEIKFENEQALWSILSAAVKETLGKFNVVPSIDFDTDGAPDIPVISSATNIHAPHVSFNPRYNPFKSSAPQTYSRPTLAQDWQKLYEGFEQSRTEDVPPQNVDGLSVTYETDTQESTLDFSTSEGDGLPETTGVQNLQLKRRYILTGIKSGLLLIDQQRAHTRILYDDYLKQLEQQKQVAMQQLLFPELLDLSLDEASTLEQLSPELCRAGFDIIRQDERHCLVRGIPSQIQAGKIPGLLRQVLADAGEAADRPTRHIHETIAEALAATACIEYGQSLTDREMGDIIDRLFASTNPNYSPEGKKIFAVIAYDDLEKLF